MKKFLCFLSAFCVALGLGAFLPQNSVYCADETGPVLISSQENFASALASESKNFKLSENIELSGWTGLDISGITLDGAGFSITTDAPIFNTVFNSTLSNLYVKTSPNFEFVGGQNVENFGVVAKVLQGGTILSTFVEMPIRPSDASEEDVYGKVSVTLNASGSVGGFVGVVSEGSVIKNCGMVGEVDVIQNSATAQSTIVGGFCGEVLSASIITNSYSVPRGNQLVKADFSSTISTVDREIIVGGFSGKIDKHAGKVINVFSGGALPQNSALDKKTILVGRISGSALCDETQLNHVYTFNQNSALGFLGLTAQNQTVGYVPQDVFKLLGSFEAGAVYNQKVLWNEIYGWDTAGVWCKVQSSDFLVLQVFQNFTISVNEERNKTSGVRIEIWAGDKLVTTEGLDDDGQVADVPASETTQKYGTKLQLKVVVEDEYKPYKNVKRLMVGSTQVGGLVIDATGKTAMAEVVVAGATSGIYYATSENVGYNLKVVSENEAKGKVRVWNASANIDSAKPFTLTYLSTQSFEAVSENNSYTFEKWVWLNEGGEPVQTLVGDPNSEKSASRVVNVKFGTNEFSAENISYVYIDGEGVPNIPYKIIDGVVTFTLQAVFSEHNEDLIIVIPSSITGVEIRVADIFVPENEEIDGVYYTTKLTIGIPVKVEIAVPEGYTFKGWRVENQSLSDLIDKQGGETEMSTTITVKLSGETRLIADVVKAEVSEVDLTWLWYVLGGVIGAGTITGLTIWLVRRRQQERFTDYY